MTYQNEHCPMRICYQAVHENGRVSFLLADDPMDILQRLRSTPYLSRFKGFVGTEKVYNRVPLEYYAGRKDTTMLEVSLKEPEGGAESLVFTGDNLRDAQVLDPWKVSFLVVTRDPNSRAKPLRFRPIPKDRIPKGVRRLVLNG
ncbi:MAG: hypothetical protein V1659_02240 [Candidatus Woesearchaeota archaeon]